MIMPLQAPAIAREALSAIDKARQIPPFSGRDASFDLARAYQVTDELRRLRIARGEVQVGRKIGFTNRNIWVQYGVHGPIWGDIYDGTLHDISSLQAPFPLAGLCEPQIEPEIVLALSRTPESGMDEHALLGCIGSIAHGFEIVQSIYPGWKFSAADTVAAGGLHGALLLGPSMDIATIDDPLRTLSTFTLTLSRGGETVDGGSGANVLGSPVLALQNLVETLARDPFNAPLREGEIVTTGTVTRAFPVAAGQTWTTYLGGVPLGGLTLTFG